MFSSPSFRCKLTSHGEQRLPRVDRDVPKVEMGLEIAVPEGEKP